MSSRGRVGAGCRVGRRVNLAVVGGGVEVERAGGVEELVFEAGMRRVGARYQAGEGWGWFWSGPVVEACS